MDELFGAADYSNVEDVGIAAKHAREKEDVDEHEDVQDTVVTKV